MPARAHAECAGKRSWSLKEDQKAWTCLSLDLGAFRFKNDATEDVKCERIPSPLPWLEEEDRETESTAESRRCAAREGEV
jgi:hypothetical protein